MGITDALKIPLVTVALFGVSAVFFAPMATVQDEYDVHLWSERDAIHYQPSTLQRHCQNLHVATAVTLAFGLVLTFVYTSLQGRLSPLTKRRFDVISNFTVLVAGALYIASLITLMSLLSDVKNRLDDLPFPLPDVRVRAASGAYLDGLGVIAAFSASVVSLFSLMVGARDGYQELA